MIDKRLQDRLRKETDSVRRAEEAKKDKHTANRKEEEIQLKNTIVSRLCVSLDVGKLMPPGILLAPTSSLEVTNPRQLLAHVRCDSF